MSDLAQMMQVAPGTASFFMGQNQANKVAEDRLKQRELADLIAQRAAEAQQKAQMNPLMLENQQLQNRGLQEGLGGITADSQMKRLKAERDAATQGSTIDATNFENADKVNKGKYEQFERGQKFMMQAGAQLAEAPPALRAGVFRQMIEQAGMNANAPHLQAMMLAAQRDPDALPKMAQAMAERLGKQALAMNPAAQASMYGHRLAAEASKYGDDKRLEGTKYSADERARTARAKTESKLKEADSTIARWKEGKIPNDRLLSIAQYELTYAQTDEERKKWMEAGIAAQNAMKYSGDVKNDGKNALGEDGNIVQREAKPPITREEAPKAGQTKSGVKFKIITQ